MYDAIIIGCGPAGLTAGLYLARANKKVKIFEKGTIGGQMASSPLIENYPGYDKISGSELAMNMYKQAVDSGVEVDIEEVLSITTNCVITDEGSYNTKCIIIATGARYRKLLLDNEENLIGNGIHFCSVCDGSFYKDKDVCVIGGGNSAAVNSLYLSNICRKVYLIYRNDELKCDELIKNRIKNNSNILMISNSEVIRINGEDFLRSIDILKDGNEKNIKVDGMFESIGLVAETNIFKDMLERDGSNYFVHNDTETKYPNIFVVGDCVSKEYRQIATAVNDGVVAANKVIKYLDSER